MVMAMRRLDDDATADKAIEELVELIKADARGFVRERKAMAAFSER